MGWNTLCAITKGRRWQINPFSEPNVAMARAVHWSGRGTTTELLEMAGDGQFKIEGKRLRLFSLRHVSPVDPDTQLRSYSHYVLSCGRLLTALTTEVASDIDRIDDAQLRAGLEMQRSEIVTGHSRLDLTSDAGELTLILDSMQMNSVRDYVPPSWRRAEENRSLE